MRSAKDFFKPKAIGAPLPPREIPFRPSRMIHFFDPSNPKMAAKIPDLAKRCDVLLEKFRRGYCYKLRGATPARQAQWRRETFTRDVSALRDRLIALGGLGTPSKLFADWEDLPETHERIATAIGACEAPLPPNARGTSVMDAAGQSTALSDFSCVVLPDAP